MSPEISNLIRRIEIQTTQLAKDILAGTYRSAFKGRGIEFEETREYQPGDEVRSIDWPVTARMNHPYVKVFREERELTVMLLVDMSASWQFGSGKKTKKEIISEIGALLAFSAIKNSDKVGMIFFTDRVEKYFPPRKTARHVLRLIRELLTFKPTHQGTNISEALSYLGKVEIKPGICFLISDFISPDFEHQATLISLKHDLVGISVTDPIENNLPNLRLATLHDLENPRGAIIDTSNTNTEKQYKENAEQRIETVKHLFQKLGAGFIDIRTDKSYVTPIRNFFKMRSRHR